jgi:acyl-homoserine lactone acylase PvdQ
MTRSLLAAVLAALLLPATALAVDPYGANDAGGFRNVLPPGSNGHDNAVDLAAFQATGRRPAHWDDQQPLYDGLVKAAPNLTRADLGGLFKDATFGVRDGDVASTEQPRPGVTIVRDAGYGVPHVYGVTRADVMYGAGWAGAEDRLFLMDVLRHTGRAQLSSFAGGSAANREMDRTQWRLAPYTEADLQRQIDDAPRLYGADGRAVVDDVTAYIQGINAWIAKARLDPTLLPAEYVALGKLPEDWKTTDVIATASLIGGIFGKGGGREVDSAQVLQALEQRFGTSKGRAAWRDFREKRDPETITTIRGTRFPYEDGDPFAKRGLALPDPGSVKDAPVAPPVDDAPAPAAPAPPAAPGPAPALPPLPVPPLPAAPSVAAALLQAASAPPHASNWLLVSAAKSATGHPIAVMGPQVGYYVPQILMELDLHGPGIDARGAAFPGVNLYVQLGHGRDYAWSATTANSDNVDTFAEVLCRDDTHYRYKGECRAMEKLERTNAWTPNATDQTPPGSETLSVYRTVHGIVVARGTVGGRKVAFAQARTTYFHEADSALGFRELNDPGFVRGPESFMRAASDINFGFNWAYVDAQHIAYYQSGWYPERAEGTSPDFPVLGTGAYDWRGRLGFAEHPHVVDQDYLVSWNNRQAPGWSAADDQYSYGSVQRAQLLDRHVRAGLRDGGRLELPQLVRAMGEPATQDLRGVKVLPALLRALGTPPDARSREAIATLRAWTAGGAHRRDLDGDGRYDDDAAVTLMDAWWPRLVKAEFEPALRAPAFAQVGRLLRVGDHTEGDPTAPDFFDGWWGYVHKDLRTLLDDRAPAGRFSRVYCGGGSLAACRGALRASLRDALGVTRAHLYGKGDCRDDPDAECFDRNRATVAAGIDVPPAPFQNRPTFQQTVELTRSLPR